MSIIRACLIAFSIYSKIPMPHFDFKDEDMKYHLIFFPLVGALIGGVLYGWLYLANMYGLSDISRTCIGVVIPLLITGGFHVDGFMDTMDAFSSYKGREEKLRILKDPHIGAFSVIKLVTLMLIYLAAFSEILDEYVSAYVSVFFIAMHNALRSPTIMTLSLPRVIAV